MTTTLNEAEVRNQRINRMRSSPNSKCITCQAHPERGAQCERCRQERTRLRFRP